MSSALVVDDDSTVGDVVGAYLERAGFEVRRAADGATALDLAASETPDVVVLDLMLPGIGGLEVCRRLRRDHPRVPVVMLISVTARATGFLDTSRRGSTSTTSSTRTSWRSSRRQ